jgi:hypothetical protein
MNKKTVVFDFDGVIHSYTSGWIGDTCIPDLPVPGIREAIAGIRKKYRVVVVSTRCASEEGKAAIKAWLSKYDIVVDDITKEKPPAVVYVDDRAICFDGRADLLAAKIDAFQPWYMNLENIALWFLIGEKDGVKTYACSSCGLYLATYSAEPPKECPICHMRMKGE